MSYLGTAVRRYVSVSNYTMTRPPNISNVLRKYQATKGARMYSLWNTKEPLLTKGLTGGFLAFMGDSVAQYVAWSRASQREAEKGDNADYSKVPSYDLWRGLSFFSYSVWYNAYPWNWYLKFASSPATNTLENGARGYLKSMLSTPMYQAAVTTLIWNPLFYIPTFYIFYGVTNTAWRPSTWWDSLYTLVNKCKIECPEAIKQIVMVYAPIYAVQFAVIPPSLQVAYASFANFVWCVILSSLAASDAVVDEETHKFERFDSNAITVGGLLEQAKEQAKEQLPAELALKLDSATVDRVFQQLKSSKQVQDHKMKAADCEEAAATSASIEEKNAEEDFGRLVRLLQDDRFRFFRKVELLTEAD